MAKRPSSAEDLADLQDSLRKAGLRSTTARIAVLRRLRSANSPLSHAELADELTPHGFDKATVFRNLNDLADAGLVVRTELGDHVWRFEIVNRRHDEPGHHPHFVCVACGQVTCLAGVSLPPALKSRSKRIGSVTEILLRGRCRNCE
ncbi:MAG: transcriptional repressor [Planctomycetia bacterium]|nr:transcriptional repressor [Planctomycetia bacterium]